MLRNIIKSPHDIRVYKNISLQNKINCLLISDKDADKSAASLSVKVGQIQDPVDRPGLAHFLEHMLFLGTKKYPNQNDYSSYIASNSGSNNAYTGLTNTNYFFDCSNSAFEGALDRFSQFFISPLFTESCTDREINAVHSEHEKNLMSDVWRKMQLFRSTAIEGHPYNKFGTGHKGTLQHPTIRDDLLGFYGKYYSANLMNLVIYGKEDVATLENWAQQLFSTVPNFDTEIPRITDAAYTKENLGNFWKIHPIKDKDFLEFTWIIDNLDPHYKNNPASYISHLIGHEGPNSLLSYLIDQGLALELSAGFNTEMDLFSKFGIGIMLTKKGMANYQEVIRIVFEYLKMLRDRGAEERIFQEVKKMMKIGFDFKDKESPMNYVMSLADRMHNFPVEDIVRLSYLMEQYNPDLINSCINSLKVDNLRINLVSKEVEKDCDRTEKWYGTKYSCTPFSSQLKAMFENPGTSISTSGKRLDLPPPNIFIPENFQLFTAHSQNMSKFPQKIYESDKTEIYYKQDITFKKPKASMYVKLFCNDLDFGSNLKSYLLLDLWTKLFNEYLREMLYLASSASLGVSVSMDSEGIETAISGYNDSIDKISVALFEKMRDFDPRLFQQQYHNILETTLKNLRNFYKNQPYQQAMTFQGVMMKKGGDNYLPEEEIQALEELKFEDLISFHENWFRTTRLEGLFMGNMKKDQVIQVSKEIEKIVASLRERASVLAKEEIPEVRVINLQPNTTWFYEHESKIVESGQVESNSAILSLFQFEKETPYTRVLMSILGNYMREPCFDKLRTDEQLGYIVSGFNADMRGILNYIILVQSNVQGPQYLSSRIISFLDSMRERIKTLTDEDFAKYVESVRVRILQKDLSIRQEAGRYWSEIANHKYVFDRKDRDLEQLDKVKKEDLLWVFEEIFYRNRKSFETHVVSVNHAAQNQKIKEQRMKDEKHTLQAHSPAWFKRRLPLYPDFNSML